MKDIVAALKEARNKCTDTADKSTLRDLDEVIQKLEEKTKEKPKQAHWLAYVVKAFALIRLLAGEIDSGE